MEFVKESGQHLKSTKLMELTQIFGKVKGGKKYNY